MNTDTILNFDNLLEIYIITSYCLLICTIFAIGAPWRSTGWGAQKHILAGNPKIVVTSLF